MTVEIKNITTNHRVYVILLNFQRKPTRRIGELLCMGVTYSFKRSYCKIGENEREKKTLAIIKKVIIRSSVAGSDSFAFVHSTICIIIQSSKTIFFFSPVNNMSPVKLPRSVRISGEFYANSVRVCLYYNNAHRPQRILHTDRLY